MLLKGSYAVRVEDIMEIKVAECKRILNFYQPVNKILINILLGIISYIESITYCII